MRTSIRNCVFAFKCEQKWDNLETLSIGDARFCHDCNRMVHLCKTDKQLREAITRNDCVAIEIRRNQRQGLGAMTTVGVIAHGSDSNYVDDIDDTPDLLELPPPITEPLPKVVPAKKFKNQD